MWRPYYSCIKWARSVLHELEVLTENATPRWTHVLLHGLLDAREGVPHLPFRLCDGDEDLQLSAAAVQGQAALGVYAFVLWRSKKHVSRRMHDPAPNMPCPVVCIRACLHLLELRSFFPRTYIQ